MTLLRKPEFQRCFRFSKHLWVAGTLVACATTPTVQMYEAADKSDISQRHDITIDFSKPDDMTYNYGRGAEDSNIKNERIMRLESEIRRVYAKQIFLDGLLPTNSECYTTALSVTFCRIPVNTKIKKRKNSDAFATQTGFILCYGATANRGPCIDMKPKASK